MVLPYGILFYYEPNYRQKARPYPILISTENTKLKPLSPLVTTVFA